MPSLDSMAYHKNAYQPGIRWHEPSQQFIAEIGYHEVRKTAPDGTVTTKRVRTTHYLGGNHERTAYMSKFASLKADWEGTVAVQRQAYDAEQSRRRREKLPLLPRFKPNWPMSVERTSRSVAPIVAQEPIVSPLAQSSLYPVPAFTLQANKERAEIFGLTIKQAYDRYLPQQKARIGLHGGKGINANSYKMHSQNLTLSLALNKEYVREIKPIDVNKRLCDLTEHDYEAFVQFWCNSAHAKSERTTVNYTGAFSRMLRRLKIPLPERFDEIFRLKITQPTKIVRYNPELLKPFIQHPNERTRLICLMCLNLGYYQVDIARLKFEHITDFHGNPYQSGEMFITKRRERTLHQNQFTTTAYVWPETQQLMEQFRAPLRNPTGHYFLTQFGLPYQVRGIGWAFFDAARKLGLSGVFSMKQFRKVGASQIKALDGSDAMHQYKANALNAADRPYIDEDYSRLTNALKKLRDKLIADGVL